MNDAPGTPGQELSAPEAGVENESGAVITGIDLAGVSDEGGTPSEGTGRAAAGAPAAGETTIGKEFPIEPMERSVRSREEYVRDRARALLADVRGNLIHGANGDHRATVAAVGLIADLFEEIINFGAPPGEPRD